MQEKSYTIVKTYCGVCDTRQWENLPAMEASVLAQALMALSGRDNIHIEVVETNCDLEASRVSDIAMKHGALAILAQSTCSDNFVEQLLESPDFFVLRLRVAPQVNGAGAAAGETLVCEQATTEDKVIVWTQVRNKTHATP